VRGRRDVDGSTEDDSHSDPSSPRSCGGNRRRTAYQGDDEFVFVSPTRGTPFDYGRYGKTLGLALAEAKIYRCVRPFHDGRHTSITNAAAAGASPEALMTYAGHASYATTRG
jgi:integrase